MSLKTRTILSSREDDGPFYSIFQFSYSAGPVIGHQLVNPTGTERRVGRKAYFPTFLLDKVPDKGRDIVLAFPQGRQRNREGTQAHVEEFPLL